MADFLLLKFYGQPYIPLDPKELAYVVVLYSKLWTAEAATLVKDHYSNHSAPIYAIIRDLLLGYLLLRTLGRTATTIRGNGVVKCVKMVGKDIAKRGASVFMALPPVKRKVAQELGKTVKMIEGELMKNDENLLQFPQLPEEGIPSDEVISEIDLVQLSLAHSDWANGKVSGAVYHGGKDLLHLQLVAYEKYSVANQLHPDVFPGIRKMEAEVVAMVLRLFNASELACGSTTSGGTESLLLTALAAREYGLRKKGITRPEIIAPMTVHAGIDKACYYFKIKLHKVDLDENYQVDIAKVKRLINSNTILLVGSAPNYPHGIIDDISELSKLGVRYSIPLHVDACLGSFIVSFLEKSKVHGDRKLPLFDFRLPGVTSISCDTHKYGFAPKGSSIIMYSKPELRECQYYVLSDWAGGMYGSPTLAGSRPGALMAGCWATLINVGEKGYAESCYSIVSATMQLKDTIKEHPVLKKHLEVIGDPIGSVIAFKVRDGSNVNVYQVGDAMGKKGWHLATLQHPAALHFALTRLTVPVIGELVSDLVETVEVLEKKGGTGPVGDTAAVYGVAGSVSTAGVADRIIVAFLDTLYKLG